MNRKPVFDAFRKILGRGFNPSEVRYIDLAFDEAEGVITVTAPKPEGRQINQAGLDLIKRFEGLRTKTYYCPASVLTIGYGSTGPHVKKGMEISEARAEELLREDLSRFEKAVAEKCPKATDNQFSAMVSLAFNIGIAGFNRSTVAKRHNAENYEGAARAFLMWNKAGGRVLAGLVRRREAEAELYRRK